MKKTTTTFVLLLVFGAAVSMAQTNSVSVKLDSDDLRTVLESLRFGWFEMLVSGVVGGLIATLGGAYLNRDAHKLDKNSAADDERQFMCNLLSAIRRELECIGAVYDNGIGPKVEEVKEGQALVYKLGLTQNWFSVFESNASHLGRIEVSLSRKIITVYITAKSLIEEFRINNIYLQEMSDITMLLQRQSSDQFATQRKAQIGALLAAQATRLKERSRQLKSLTNELMTDFDAQGIK